MALVAITAVATSGSESGELEADATTTVVATPTTPTTTRDASAPPTTEGSVSTTRVTTTTEDPTWTLESIQLDPRLSALDVEVVMVDGSELRQIDTAAGEMRSFALRSEPQQPVIEVGADWLLLTDVNSRARLFRGLDAPDEFESVWDKYRQPGTDRFWELSSGPSETITVFETEPDGTRTGGQIDFGRYEWPIAADPAGGFLVSAPGGVYHSGADGSSRLTTGDLFAVGPTAVLVYECGSDFHSCGLYVLDRTSGATRAIVPIDTAHNSREVTDYANPNHYIGYPGVSLLSPDGRFAPLVDPGGGPSFGVIDLATGGFTRLASFSESRLWWSADSSVVLFIAAGQLIMHDLASGISTPVLESTTVRAFAVRDH